MLAALMNYNGLNITVQDADKFDETNRSRQWMARIAGISNMENAHKNQIAKNIWPEINTVTRWYNGEEVGTQNDLNDHGEMNPHADVIIACVDNHPTRNQLRDMCRANRIPMIMPGNLDDYGQCYTYAPQYQEEEWFKSIDPWEMDTSLREHVGMHPHEAEREDGCDSGVILVTTPQVALANMTAAVLAARHLENLLTMEDPQNLMIYSFFSRGGISTKYTRNLAPKKEQQQ